MGKRQRKELLASGQLVDAEVAEATATHMSNSNLAGGLGLGKDAATFVI
jgi:hypothetical protein